MDEEGIGEVDGGGGAVAVVVMVVASEDLGVELGPAGACVGVVAARVEGVACSADSDYGFTAIDMVTDGLEVFFREGASADTDHE